MASDSRLCCRRPAKRGRPPIDRRAILDAILYVVRTGCQWRQLPHRLSQVEDGLHRLLAVAQGWRVASEFTTPCGRRVRQASGKKPTPSAWRSSTANRCARPKEAKNVATMRAKRSPAASDTWPSTRWGWCGRWSCMEPSGKITTERLLSCALRRLGRLKVIFADTAYGRNGLPDWVQETFGWILQTVLRPVQAKGFVVLPKRWIVERTFAWLARYRRHAETTNEHRNQRSHDLHRHDRPDVTPPGSRKLPLKTRS